MKNRIVVLLAILTSAGVASISGQAPSDAPVEARIPFAPIPAKSNGQTIVAYELHLTNLGARELTLNRIEVFNQDTRSTPIASYQNANLITLIVQPGNPSTTSDKRKIAGGMRAIVYMWLTFDNREAIPRTLRHRFVFTLEGADGKTEEHDLEVSGTNVPQGQPITVASPLKGGGFWYAVNGPSNQSVHRRALLPVAGEAHISQRFATDWTKFGDDGKAWHGDSKSNANWYGYGVEVIAVADAVVSAVKDGIPENVPLSPARAVPITLETVGGNHVILSLRNGHYAFYAHLQPGSIRVKPGDRVRRGQVLGLLGNSGNSDAPHLHFHISNGDSPMGSEGVPFLFDSFEVLGSAEMEKVFTQGWTVPAAIKPDKRVRDMPVENQVVTFD
jgi:murein DD-endopeptidase MepM/ murein hydrolase activator NlpD